MHIEKRCEFRMMTSSQNRRMGRSTSTVQDLRHHLCGWWLHTGTRRLGLDYRSEVKRPIIIGSLPQAELLNYHAYRSVTVSAPKACIDVVGTVRLL